MDHTYTYGKLENGNIVYFVPINGGLVVKETKRGRTSTVFYPNPSEAVMNAHGWYRIVNVEDVGTDYQSGNIIYHYVGRTNNYIEIGDEEGSAEYNNNNE